MSTDQAHSRTQRDPAQRIAWFLFLDLPSLFFGVRQRFGDSARFDFHKAPLLVRQSVQRQGFFMESQPHATNPPLEPSLLGSFAITVRTGRKWLELERAITQAGYIVVESSEGMSDATLVSKIQQQHALFQLQYQRYAYATINHSPSPANHSTEDLHKQQSQNRDQSQDRYSFGVALVTGNPKIHSLLVGDFFHVFTFADLCVLPWAENVPQNVMVQAISKNWLWQKPE